MRKLFLLSLSVVSLLFISCSSDDDDSSEGSIIGKWQLQSGTFTDRVGVEIDESTDCRKMSTIEFTESVITFISFDQSKTFSNGELVSLGECEMTVTILIDYYIDGKQMIIESPTENKTTEIVSRGDVLIVTFTDDTFNEELPEITVSTYKRI